MKGLLTLLALFCAIPLFALIDESKEIALTKDGTTTLVDGTIYKIDYGGTYTVTTNGASVNTRIAVRTEENDEVTLLLNNCHINTAKDLISEVNQPRYYYGAPLLLAGQNTRLTLKFQGVNVLSPDKEISHLNDYFSSAITLQPRLEHRNLSLNIEGVDSNAKLTLYGRTCLGSDTPYSPIFFPSSYNINETTYTITSTISFKQGITTLVTSDSSNISPYLAPAITATNVSLYDTTFDFWITSAYTNSTITWKKAIDAYTNQQTLHPLIQCQSFKSENSHIVSTGKNTVANPNLCIGSSNKSSYGTTYAVPNALFTLPIRATDAYGTLYAQTFTTFYGLNTQGESNALKACFLPTGDVSLSSNALTINAAQAQPKFADNHLNPTTALAASRLFQLPLTATDQGFTMQPYAFGIRTITATKLQVSLEIALDLPNIDASLTTKAMSLHILCNGTIVSQSPTQHTFTRQTGTDTFITTVTVPYPFGDNTQGTACYTVRAISE